MDTAFCPPSRNSTAFIRMEVIRPEILLRKLGLPQATICRTMPAVNRGRQNFSWSFPRAKGNRAMATQATIPREEARAAAQIPRSSTTSRVNSNRAVRMDMRMFSHMLMRILPQMRR